MVFTKRIPITRGWSGDKKYCVTDERGRQYLLRISPAEQELRKRRQFERMQQVAALGVPMCAPVEFGTCEEGVYSIQSWINGVDVEVALKAMPEAQQYTYGLDAGRILRKIHSIPAPADLENWEARFNRKMDRKIQMYCECPLKYENGQAFLDFIQANRHLLEGRPQTYQHGDYHVGNMMAGADGVLYIIDFDRDDFGDPWEEFNRIVWCVQAAPAFAAGMVDGYFGGAVPMEFWRLLALYIASNALSSLPWAIPFGEGEIAVMRRQAREILDWYDNMTCVVPKWYSRYKAKWLFFDIGSTLVDEQKAYDHRIRDMIAGTELTFAEVHAKRVELAKQGMDGNAAVIAYYGLSKTPWHSEDETLYPDAKPILEVLANRGYRLGVLANQNPGLRARLAAWGIADYFAVIASSSELGLAKPGPAIFEKALEMAGCAPSEAVMVGDRLDNDILPAKRAGMHTVWLRTGLAAQQPRVLGAGYADHIVDSLLELEELPL